MSVVSGPEVECCTNLKQRLVTALQQLSLQTFIFGEFVHISGTLAFSIDGKQDYQVIVSEMTNPETRVTLEGAVTNDINGFKAANIKTELKTELYGEMTATTKRGRGRPRKNSLPLQSQLPPVAAADGSDVEFDNDLDDDDSVDIKDDNDRDEDYVPDQVIVPYVQDDVSDDINASDVSDTTEIYEPGKSMKRIRPRRGRVPKPRTGKMKCTESDCSYQTDHRGHYDYHMKKHRGVKDVECDICGKGFFAADEVRRHKNNAHGKNWHCNKCAERFQLKVELREHLTKEHDYTIPGKLEAACCTYCQAKFISNADLEKHTNESHNHICSICGESFTQTSLLKKHTRSTHPESVLTCNECGKKCGSRSALKKHVHRHREKESGGFSCDVCGKTFTSQGSMYHHKKGLHSGIKPYECTECDAKFSFNHSLKLHILKHKGLRPYPCPQCEKSYLTNNHLKMHVQAVHCTERKYRCPVCNKGFPYENSLKMHMMLHTDSKPFMCCICSKGFVSKSALKVHEATHVEGKHFECDVCHKKYKTQMLLRAHRRRHTQDGSRFMCDICGSVFMYKSNLDAHYSVHGDSRNFQCKECGKLFKTYATLYSHQQVHRSDSPFICHCGKAFKSKERLKAHDIRHSGLKPHSCLICNNSFPDKGGLSKHMKTVHAKVPRFACPVCHKTCNRADNLRVHMKVHNDPELFKLSLQQLSITGEVVDDDSGDMNTSHLVAPPDNHHQQQQQQQSAFSSLNQKSGEEMAGPGKVDQPPHVQQLPHAIPEESPPLVIDDRNMVSQHGSMPPPLTRMDMLETGTPGLIDLSMSTPSTVHGHHHSHNNTDSHHAVTAHYTQLASSGAMYYPSLAYLPPNTLLPPPPEGGHHYHIDQ